MKVFKHETKQQLSCKTVLFLIDRFDRLRFKMNFSFSILHHFAARCSCTFNLFSFGFFFSRACHDRDDEKAENKSRSLDVNDDDYGACIELHVVEVYFLMYIRTFLSGNVCNKKDRERI